MSDLLDKVKGQAVAIATDNNAVAVSFHSRSLLACQYFLLGIASTLASAGKPHLALKVLSHMPTEGSSPDLFFEERG